MKADTNRCTIIIKKQRVFQLLIKSIIYPTLFNDK